MAERHLGYTVDGQPVVLWTQRNAWTGEEEAFLEAGNTQIQLDHVDPSLESAVKASLQRQVA